MVLCLKHHRTKWGSIVAAFVVLVSLFFSQFLLADADRIAQGKEIAFDRKKGNCLACHMIDDGALPGTTGPPLLAMQQRYPDLEALVAQISNPLTKNPNSLMPPFGLHNILSEDEIQKIAEYIHTL